MGQVESSRTGISKGIEKVRDLRKCMACHEMKHFFDIIQVSCGHDYCRDCVTELFNLATTDESLFPPRCCRQEIEVDMVFDFLNPDLLDRFSRKAVEFRTVNRTYCVSSSCSKFIIPADIQNDVATCSACLRRTCTVCKREAHQGNCPNDTALQQVLKAAIANGWQRCPSCRQMIELDHGCNHVM